MFIQDIYPMKRYVEEENISINSTYSRYTEYKLKYINE